MSCCVCLFFIVYFQCKHFTRENVAQLFQKLIPVFSDCVFYFLAMNERYIECSAVVQQYFIPCSVKIYSYKIKD